MAVKTVSIGNMEDWHQYDDTETYDDASVVQGIKAATVQVTTAPADAADVIRLDDIDSVVASEYWQSPVIDKDLTIPPF